MKRFLLGLTALVMALTLALSVAVAEASIPLSLIHIYLQRVDASIYICPAHHNLHIHRFPAGGI